MPKTKDHHTVEELVEHARLVARASLAKLDDEARGRALQRLEAPEAPGALQPAVVVSISLSPAEWQLRIDIVAAKPMRIIETSGLLAAPSEAAA